MQLVASILCHEKPDIIRDQIANFQAFLPGVAIILHLHVDFQQIARAENFEKIDQVFVNPVSVPTFWGNLHHAHHSNFHFAKKTLGFDVFLLHSSSDLFVHGGAVDFINKFDAGVSFVAPQATWGGPLFAEGDPVFQRIMADANAKELWCSQVEGTFYRREVFNEIVSLIERHFDFRKTRPYVHEEIYYPTIAKAMDIQIGHPYLLREDKELLPALDNALVDIIRAKNLPDYEVSRWKLGRQVTSTVWKGQDIFAMRPIPRVMDHPLRAYIRSIQGATSGK